MGVFYFFDAGGVNIKDSLTICTKENYQKFITGLISSIGPKHLDYYIIEDRGSKYNIYTKSFTELPCEKICMFLADWIIDYMEEEIMYEILILLSFY